MLQETVLAYAVPQGCKPDLTDHRSGLEALGTLDQIYTVQRQRSPHTTSLIEGAVTESIMPLTPMLVTLYRTTGTQYSISISRSLYGM
jgi:hypothetical protein